MVGLPSSASNKFPERKDTTVSPLVAITGPLSMTTDTIDLGGGRRVSAAAPAATQAAMVAAAEKARSGPKVLADAQFDYRAKTIDQLSFNKGDVLVILKQDAEGWWLASDPQQFKKAGKIPHNYVKVRPTAGGDKPPFKYDQCPPQEFICLYDYDSRTDNELSFKKNDVLVVIGTLPSGSDWWVAHAPEVGKKGCVPTTYVKKVLLTARALYDYGSTDKSHLAFTQGDTIRIYSKDNSGWWAGCTSAGSGLFPHNYVEEVPAQK